MTDIDWKARAEAAEAERDRLRAEYLCAECQHNRARAEAAERELVGLREAARAFARDMDMGGGTELARALASATIADRVIAEAEERGARWMRDRASERCGMHGIDPAEVCRAARKGGGT